MKLIHHFDFKNHPVLDRSIFNVRSGDTWFNDEEQRYTDAEDTLFFNDEGLVFQALLKEGLIRKIIFICNMAGLRL